MVTGEMRDQQMEVIGHHYKFMQVVLVQLVIVEEDFDKQARHPV